MRDGRHGYPSRNTNHLLTILIKQGSVFFFFFKTFSFIRTDFHYQKGLPPMLLVVLPVTMLLCV